jgi:hypothetical protein
MRLPILSSIILVILSGALPIAAANEDFFQLQCEPITTVIPLGWGPNMRGPSLAVVDTEIRPKRTRLLLDGRTIGRAGDFDGFPGPLFLEAGRYRLRAELGGYQTAVFEIEARSDCLFQIKHRMLRIPDTQKETKRNGPFVATPVKDIYGPMQPQVPAAVNPDAAKAGPDLSLRPELESALPPHQQTPESSVAQIRFAIEPGHAAVYLDGAFVGTAEQLSRMELPLAVAAGDHRIEVIAPGFQAQKQELKIAAGAMMEIKIVAERNPAGQNAENGP